VSVSVTNRETADGQQHCQKGFRFLQSSDTIVRINSLSSNYASKYQSSVTYSLKWRLSECLSLRAKTEQGA